MPSLGAIITIILVVVWVVRGIAQVAGNKEQKSETQDPDAMKRWQAEQARRRRELFSNDPEEAHGVDQSRAQVIAGRGGQPVRDFSQISMAERVELARQRAREESGLAADDASEALKQARERAEGEARRLQKQAEQRRHAAREQAEQRKLEQARRRRTADRQRAQQQRAQAERNARQQSRNKRRGARPKRSSGPAGSQGNLSEIQAREARMRTQSQQRVHVGLAQGQGVQEAKASRRKRRGSISVGPINPASLRRAIVMKELLDKPIALRNPQDELLS